LMEIEKRMRGTKSEFRTRARCRYKPLFRDPNHPIKAGSLFSRLLSPVYGWFTEGFDTRDLKEAKALLDALAAARG